MAEQGLNLFRIFYNGNVEEAQRALEAGVDPNIAGPGRRSCLMLAVSNNQEEVVDLLLSQPGIEVNAKDLSNYSALHYACMSGNVAILGKLLAAPGVQFNQKTMWGMTPIMLAIAHGQTDAAQMMADVDKVNLQVKKSFETKAGGDGHWMDPNRFDWETLEQFNDKYNVR